ncbi:MAG: hypothetical protein ACRDQT_10650 [Gaiellaceae bacterium]
MERAEREAIMRQGVVLPETPRQRREREALEEDLRSAPLRGKPLSLRLTNFRPVAGAYLAAARGPLAYMLRLHEIERQTATHAVRLEEAWRALALEHEGAVPVFEREWRETASHWSFDEVNDLIGRHNRWYPVESRLGMDPSTGEFALVNGRDYRLPELDAEWVLRSFPPVLARARVTS